METTSDKLRKAGFKCKGFGSNEHWDNGEVVVFLNEDNAQWIDDGKGTILSFDELHARLNPRPRFKIIFVNGRALFIALNIEAQLVQIERSVTREQLEHKTIAA